MAFVFDGQLDWFEAAGELLGDGLFDLPHPEQHSPGKFMHQKYY
jgi:hypothetical protein